LTLAVAFGILEISPNQAGPRFRPKATPGYFFA